MTKVVTEEKERTAQIRMQWIKLCLYYVLNMMIIWLFTYIGILI